MDKSCIHDVKRVAEVENQDSVNEALAEGWILLNPHFPYQPCRACRNQQHRRPL